MDYSGYRQLKIARVESGILEITMRAEPGRLSVTDGAGGAAGEGRARQCRGCGAAAPTVAQARLGERPVRTAGGRAFGGRIVDVAGGRDGVAVAPGAVRAAAGSAFVGAFGVLVVGGQTLCLLVTLLAVPVFYSLFEDLGELRLLERLGVRRGARRKLAEAGD